MTLRPCARQLEVQTLLANGHWPHACPAELRAHLAGCRSCSELALVAHAFQQARSTTAAQALLPAPGAIWWRAQLRRRHAAVERVGKPMLGAYLFALAVTLLTAGGAVLSQVRLGFLWLDGLEQSLTEIRPQFFNPMTWLNSGWSLPVLLPILATAALLSAVVVYLAAERN